MNAKSRILVVDDESGVREMLRFALSERGWEVVLAESGARALELLGEHNFQLMISDVRMPGLDGLSLLESVKSRSPRTEVVLMTGYGTLENALTAMRLGAYDFVLKPFEIDPMIRTVEKALEREELRNSLAIYAAAQGIHTSVDTGDVLQRIVEIGAGHIGADDATLLIREDGVMTTAAAAGVSGEEPLRARAALCARAGGQVPADGRSCVIVDAPDLDSIRSALVQPLSSSDGVFGALCACRTASPRPFDDADARDFSIFSTHAVQAVLNARLLRQLTAAQARLLESGRITALGRVAASVAHEINNPLTGILGSAQMLQLSALTKEQAEDVACILEQTERCRRIVVDLLNFGRGTPPQLKREPLVPLIESALKLVRWDIEAGVSIAREFDGAPAVMADGLQIKQILVNFMRNALQAMSGVKSPRMTMRIKPDGAMVRVEISNNGPGFDEAVRGKLFKPFFTTKAPGQGSGLGLSVCADIAAAHGGKVDAASRAEEGSTFSLLLPRAQEEI